MFTLVENHQLHKIKGKFIQINLKSKNEQVSCRTWLTNET